MRFTGGRARFIMSMIVVVVLATICQSSQAAGKLRFYIDKNYNLHYDAGEEYAGGWVDYKQKNSNSITSAHLDANGCLTIANLTSDDKFFCRKTLYSEPAVKGNHATAGNLFDLYLDTDLICSNGDMYRYQPTPGDAASVNNGNTVPVRLFHATLSWNLLVCLNWNADSGYIGKLKTGFKKASNYLYDVTDGQMKLGNIDVRKNVGAGDALWTDADIQITNDKQWPCSDVFGVTGLDCHVYLPKLFDGNSRTSGDPDKSNYYRTIVHELGHYLLSFYDEYIDGNADNAAWSTYRKNNKNEVPGNYGLMDYQYDASEMSSFNDYLAAYAPATTANKVTREIWFYNLSAGGGVHRPCWQRLLDVFDNRNGTLLKWSNGYNGTRVVFQEPVYGVYQGRNGSGHEIHTSSDRDGPSSITTCFFCFVEWDEADFFGAAAFRPLSADFEPQEVKLTVVAPDGSLARGARIWQETSSGRRIELGTADRDGTLVCSGVQPGDMLFASADGKVGQVTVDGPEASIDLSRKTLGTTGLGPKIILEGNLSVVSGNHNVRIKVISDAALLSPPTVYVSPAFVNPTLVTMSQIGVNTYSGTLNVGTNTQGAVDVTAVSGGGTTQISTTFRIEHLPYDQEPMLHGPENWLVARLPLGALTHVTHSITLGSGNAPILTTDPTLLCPTEPVSFHLEDGVTVGSIYTTNWKFDSDSLAGRDANTTTFKRFEPSTRMWVSVAYEFRPGYRIISAPIMPEGIYGAFYRASSDVIPPGPITNLYATTGDTNKSVHLIWTAPGDDAMTGTAVRYNILFNTVPITPDNLADCKRLQVVDEPKTAGQSENYGYQMPDPDTLYYFVIQAQDEAENLGPISNVATAKSFAQDTDNDGMPDQWEIAYGLNPSSSGDANLDPDGDGLTNLQEYQHGTSPIDPDTDDDNLSDGLEVMAGTNPLDGLAPVSTTIPGCKVMSETTKLGIGNMVCTASFADGSYGEELDRRSGIRLDGVTVPAGNIIEVIGTLSTTTNGERCLTNCFYRTKDPMTLSPIGMTNRAIGGAPLGSPPAGQQGIKNAAGANNIGLLIKTWGKVVEVDPTLPQSAKTWFKIDDGSGIRVKCVVPPGVTIDSGWQYVVVTGISSCEKSGSDLYRLVRVREESDITPVP